MSDFKFITRNHTGAIILHSDYPSTFFSELREYKRLMSKGDVDYESPLGNLNQMGIPKNIMKPAGSYQYWFQINEGKKIFPGALLYEENAGRAVKTGVNEPVEPGFFNIYDENGKLTWSAVQAAKVPRIIETIDIPPGYDLVNNVYEKHIGFNPFILINCCPGDWSDDGLVVALVGVIIKYTQGKIQICAASRVTSWESNFQPYGLSIPYAIFPNLD